MELEKLSRQQERAVYELTLKKKRSKKSTISQKQLEAVRQLAAELVDQRKPDSQPDFGHVQANESSSRLLCRCDSTSPSPQLSGAEHPLARSISSATTADSSHLHLQRQLSTSTIATASTTTSSIASSASTFSIGTQLPEATHIKLTQLRLEQLNNELERRLYQYEYLVAQEKAILGACNRALFTNQGINNFHLFDIRNQKFA